MTPFLHDEWLTMYGGDCRDVLPTLPSESVHCVVTSPPYWGLRDYGVDGQLGTEETPDEYVNRLCFVMSQVWRVLRNDGTLWLNLGDSYANDTKWGGSSGGKHVAALHGQTGIGRQKVTTGLKSKDLVGIPWRVAFALQADGWYLRSDIIWSKPNPMPESVTDRPTKSHEYLFLLSKQPRYYFDADAVRAPMSDTTGGWQTRHRQGINAHGNGERAQGAAVGGYDNPAGRNIRSVWTIATAPYPGAHFAVFPPKLVEPCIKAGTSEKGVCPECGAPWRRVVERNPGFTNGTCHGCGRPQAQHIQSLKSNMIDKRGLTVPCGANSTTGWLPSCVHGCECGKADWNRKYGEVTCGECMLPAAITAPATLLDPFAGSGTVGMVAQRLSRRAVLVDLNPSYLEQQLRRNAALPLGLVG